ncbi:transmembrane protein 256-like isoform X3 [Salvelinus namaycush]|uniref:Transmembrane protein 256-like isoform X3 n=1 Tax=Salvelinus namaycush TaxID=8040 RepID=A0A8U0QXL7_SALNM|nr:transmembrane protein 256-like isoform X3 [Salvelinus namaycush]
MWDMFSSMNAHEISSQININIGKHLQSMFGTKSGNAMAMATSLVVQRLAGVSGALAVAAGAYGAHGFKNKDPEDYSRVAGTLLVLGTGAFCGSLYHQALTEDPVLRKLAPYGGMFLIAGWLAIAI